MLKKLIRVFKWIPLIWKLSNWQYADLLQVINFQLHIMEKQFIKHGICVDAKKIAKEFHLAKLLIQRILNDDYSKGAFDFPEIDIDCGNPYCPKKRPLIPNIEPWEYDDYMKRQDLNYLCELIRKKLFCWWD